MTVIMYFWCILLVVYLMFNSVMMVEPVKWWDHIEKYHSIIPPEVNLPPPPPPPLDKHTMEKTILLYEGLMSLVCQKLDVLMLSNSSSSSVEKGAIDDQKNKNVKMGELWMYERSDRIVKLVMNLHETDAWRLSQPGDEDQNPQSAKVMQELMRLWMYRKLCDHRLRPGQRDDMSLEKRLAMPKPHVPLDEVVSTVIRRVKGEGGNIPLISTDSGSQVTRRNVDEILFGRLRFSEKHRQFVAWLLTHDFIDYGRVQLRASRRFGVGLVASQNITHNQLLFAVPKSLFLSCFNPRLHEKTKELIATAREHFRSTQSNYNEKYASLLLISIAIMSERRQPDGFFQPYLRVLPEPLSPAFYGKDAIKELHNPWVADMRHSVLNHTVRLFNVLLSKSHVFKRTLYSLYPSADSKVYDTSRMSAQRMQQIVLMSEFLWAVVSTLQRSHDWGGGERVMIPFLDFINHDSNVRVNHRSYFYNTVDDPRPRRIISTDMRERQNVSAVFLNSLHSASVGEQVFNAYHNRVNSVTLFLQYGFVQIGGHPMDFVTLHYDLPITSNRTKSYVDILRQLDLINRVHVPRHGVISNRFIRALIVGQLDAAQLFKLQQELNLNNVRQGELCAFSSVQRHIRAYELIGERLLRWCDLDPGFSRKIENAEMAVSKHHVWNETQNVRVAQKVNMLNALRFRRECHAMLDIVSQHVHQRLQALRATLSPNNNNNNNKEDGESTENELSFGGCGAPHKVLTETGESSVDKRYDFVQRLHFFHESENPSLDFRVDHLPAEDKEYLLLWPFAVINLT